MTGEGGPRALRSTRAFVDGAFRPAAIIVEGGRVADVLGHGEVGPGLALEDLGDTPLLPGLVDPHVHMNEPGRAEWEGFITATRAAAAGGVTTLVDMPLNCIPVTTTAPALETKLEAARGLLSVDVGFWGGVVPGNAAELAALVDRGALGAKCFLCHSGIDDFPASREADLRKAMPVLRDAGAPLLVHAELETAAAPPCDGARSYAAYLASRPRKWEDDAVALMVALCRETRCPVHIVHLSSSGALDAIRRAKDEGLPFTAETCPHYLCLNAEQVAEGATQFKCAPPIREAENADKLWAAVAEGLIDMVTSDHSPCTPGLKKLGEGDFGGAWGGIASLSLGLPSVYTEGLARGVSLERVVAKMTEAPAKLAGLGHKKGRIARGFDADLCAFDPGARWSVEAEALPFRHKVSPYVGRELCGRVVATWLRGEAIYGAGAAGSAASGRALLGRALFEIKPRPETGRPPRAEGPEGDNMASDTSGAAFVGLIDLAAEAMGGAALASSDDFFAGKENLIKPGRGVFLPDEYTDRGKWMDGWESRRKRGPGHDTCTLRLGVRGRVRAVDVDTNHFLGNHPPFASLEAARAPHDASVEELERATWVELIHQSPLRPGSQNLFAVSSDEAFTHVRLRIFPDGGVARLRVWGTADPEWGLVEADDETAPRLRAGEVDLASVRNGALALACSDAFFGPMNNLIAPGRSANMGGGWETRRKRLPGNDWILVRLGDPGSIGLVEIDTNHFKGNYPDRFALRGVYAPGAAITDLVAVGSYGGGEAAWHTVIGETKLGPSARHFFRDELRDKGPFTHVRLDIFPDGGVSRLRVWGARA